MTRLAYKQGEAAKQLAISENYFVEHVRPYIKSAWIGSVRVFPHVELQRWLDKESRSP